MPSHHLLMMRQFITTQNKKEEVKEEFLQLLCRCLSIHIILTRRVFPSITILIVCTEFNDTLFEQMKNYFCTFYFYLCDFCCETSLKDSSLSSGYIFLQLYSLKSMNNDLKCDGINFVIKKGLLGY